MNCTASRFTVALTLLALVSCGDGDPAAPPVPAAVEVLAGDGGSAGVATSLEVRVRVTDASGGGLAGVDVTWTVSEGGGSMDPGSSSTNASGEAVATWTLGSAAGTQTATASAGSASASFSVEAVPGDAAAVVLTPAADTLVSLGETLVLEAQAVDEWDNPVPSTTFAFASDDDAVATVGADGTVTAVQNGVAHITASAGEIQATAEIRVLQQAASVDVVPDSLQVTKDRTTEVTAVALDALGSPVADEVLVWSAEPEGLVSLVTSDDGRSVEVTGTAAGAGTLSASASVTAGVSAGVQVRVREPVELKPAADTTLSGTVSVTTLDVPDGVTITATDDLLLEVEEDVSLAGTLQGDCVDLVVEGRGAIEVTGTIANGCSGQSARETLLRVATTGGDLIVEGATVNPSGRLEMSALSAGGASGAAEGDGSGPQLMSGIHTCRYARANVAYLAADARRVGMVVANTDVRCDRIVLGGGVAFVGSSWQDRLDVDGSGIVNALRGFDGGDVALVSTKAEIRVQGFHDHEGQHFLANVLIAGSGGPGGEARSTGSEEARDAEAYGGWGGDGGSVTVEAATDLVIEGDARLELMPGSGGAGGAAFAYGFDGEDADAEEAAVRGGDALAVGGNGGKQGKVSVHLGGSVQGGSIIFGAPDANPGGSAEARGGLGGNGNSIFPDGAAGGEMEAIGGQGAEGGSVLGGLTGVPAPNPLPSAVGGKGGMAVLNLGWGGKGGHRCGFPLLPGGSGGNGGAGKLLGGLGGEPGGTPGTVYVDTGTGDGGRGGDGINPGPPGAGGDDQTQGGPRADSFRDGEFGGYCAFELTLNVSVSSDANGHEPFIGATGVTKLMMVAQEGGGLMIPSPGPFGATQVTLGEEADGSVSFTGSGSGTVAGFPGVQHTFNGILGLVNGAFSIIEATLTIDPDASSLPANGAGQRNPAVYGVGGSVELKPSGG